MLMLALLCFTTSDQLDEPFGSSGSPPFSMYIIVFSLFSRQI